MRVKDLITYLSKKNPDAEFRLRVQDEFYELDDDFDYCTVDNVVNLNVFEDKLNII